METRHEPAVNTQSFGKKFTRCNSCLAAFIAIAQMLPVIPVFGTGATFGLSDSVVVLSGILFGPWAGALASAIGGFLVR